MGFPEDNGFTLTSLYTNVEPEITQDGVLYVPPHNVNVPYYELTPTGYNICNDGIFEVSVLVRQFTNYEHGIRLMISNGTSGIQIYVYNGILHYQSRVTKIPIADIVKNVWYTYRIERSSNKNTVYLNGDMIYESEYLSNQLFVYLQ